MNITILYGGTSAEHKISIQTGLAIAAAIKDRYNLDMINLNAEIYNTPHLLLDTDLVNCFKASSAFSLDLILADPKNTMVS